MTMVAKNEIPLMLASAVEFGFGYVLLHSLVPAVPWLFAKCVVIDMFAKISPIQLLVVLYVVKYWL